MGNGRAVIAVIGDGSLFGLEIRGLVCLDTAWDLDVALAGLEFGGTCRRLGRAGDKDVLGGRDRQRLGRLCVSALRGHGAVNVDALLRDVAGRPGGRGDGIRRSVGRQGDCAARRDAGLLVHENRAGRSHRDILRVNRAVLENHAREHALRVGRVRGGANVLGERLAVGRDGNSAVPSLYGSLGRLGSA